MTSCGEPSRSSQVRASAYSVGRDRFDEVAGHRDVVGLDRVEIADDGIENLDAMDIFAAALPVDETEPALAGKLYELRTQRQMQVGQLGKKEHRRIMIRESCGEQWPVAANCRRITNCR